MLKVGVCAEHSAASHRNRWREERNDYVIAWGWWSTYGRRISYWCTSAKNNQTKPPNANLESTPQLTARPSPPCLQPTWLAAPGLRLGSHPITLPAQTAWCFKFGFSHNMKIFWEIQFLVPLTQLHIELANHSFQHGSLALRHKPGAKWKAGINHTTFVFWKFCSPDLRNCEGLVRMLE